MQNDMFPQDDFSQWFLGLSDDEQIEALDYLRSVAKGLGCVVDGDIPTPHQPFDIEPRISPPFSLN